jgi:hypothetical protein
VLLAALVVTTRPARADDPPGMGDAPASPKAGTAPREDAPKPIPDAEAAPLAEALKKAVRAKTEAEAAPAFDAIAGKAHAAFEAPLVRLLSHADARVAARAARELGARAGEKTGAALAKAYAAEGKRPDVRGAILEAMGAAGIALDPKAYDDVRSTWKLRLAETAFTPWYAGVARYFAAVRTDKRPCRLLAELLDEPLASGSVVDAANPPAEWWERRWKQWNAVRPEVEKALLAITGQTFHTSAEAKEWFAKNPAFGVTW